MENKRMVAIKTHGMYGTPIYGIWNAMLQRCSNPNLDNYRRYGGRGIKVCKEWLAFENFYKDMGDRPAGMTLDRIDNDGNYEPSNCRWATVSEQSRNTRRNRMITYQGITKPLVAWAEELNIKRGTLSARIHKGWSVQKAFFYPIKRIKK